ncbi:MAG TPA: hypothetical protein VFM09_05740 [Marmoricola sp.]|nr:hypothetical protein [Marmoricola sp.]
MRGAHDPLGMVDPRPRKIVFGIALAGAQILVLLGSLVVGPCWESWTYAAAVVQAFLALVVVVGLAVRDHLGLAALVVGFSAMAATALFVFDDMAINATACVPG